jgi:hypothetical protein
MATTITQRVTGNPAASISSRIPHRLLLSGDMQAGSDTLLLSGDESDGDNVELLSGDALHTGIGGTITQRI